MCFLSQNVPGESGLPDHIIFVCHGVGPVCDLRSRSIVECGRFLKFYINKYRLVIQS